MKWPEATVYIMLSLTMGWIVMSIASCTAGK